MNPQIFIMCLIAFASLTGNTFFSEGTIESCFITGEIPEPEPIKIETITGAFVEEIQETTTYCIPYGVCHATSCVESETQPEKPEYFCTMECVVGSMDCGQGHCEFVDNVCMRINDTITEPQPPKNPKIRI